MAITRFDNERRKLLEQSLRLQQLALELEVDAGLYSLGDTLDQISGELEAIKIKVNTDVMG